MSLAFPFTIIQHYFCTLHFFHFFCSFWFVGSYLHFTHHFYPFGLFSPYPSLFFRTGCRQFCHTLLFHFLVTHILTLHLHCHSVFLFVTPAACFHSVVHPPLFLFPCTFFTPPPSPFHTFPNHSPVLSFLWCHSSLPFHAISSLHPSLTLSFTRTLSF